MKYLFAKPEALDPDPLEAWRQQTVRLLFRLFIMVIIPLVLINTVNQFVLERWALAIPYLTLTMLVLVISLARPHNYWLRSLTMVGFFLIGSLIGIVTFGLFSIPVALLIVTVMLSILLLGSRTGTIIVIFCIAAVAMILVSFGTGVLAYPYAIASRTGELPTLVNNGILISGLIIMLAVIVSSFMNTFQANLQIIRAMLAESERNNTLLEATVASRTAEISATLAESRAATQALEERERLLREVGQIARIGGWSIDLTSQSLRWSEQIYRIYEWNEPTIPSFEQALLLYTPESRPQIEAAIIECAQSGAPWDLELPGVTVNGRPIWVRAQGEVVYTDGQITGVRGTVQEITTRKQAELALARQLRYAEALAHCSHTLFVSGAGALDWQPVVKQAIARLRTAIGCTRVGLNLFPLRRLFQTRALNIADHDPDATPFQYLPITYSEIPAWIRESLEQGEHVSGTINQFFPPESSAYTFFVQNNLYSLLAVGTHVGSRWSGYLQASDQSEEWVWDEPTIQVFRTGLEMITTFIEQQETSQELHNRETQIRAVGDNLPNGFIYQLHRDREWKPSFIYLSSGVEQILKVHPEDGLRDPTLIARLILPDDAVRMDAMSRICAAHGEDLKVVVRYQLPGEEPGWLFFCSRPHKQDDGTVIWNGVALDISEQQRATEELAHARDAAEAATRAKSKFLANMSHEIRTPLNAVIGMATLLQETDLALEQQTLATTIRTGGEALLAVINDILDFSRIESGHVELEIAPFDLPACMHNALDLVTHAAHAKGLQMIAEIDPYVPRMVIGDGIHLRQILLNLLGNAVKFTSQGHVRLHASSIPCDEGMFQLIIQVSDTGIGMTAEEQERVFKPFVQADSTTSRRYGGTGLGLAISRQLITLMGGTIELNSTSGAGSTFTMKVPLQHAPVEALPRATPPVTTSAHPLCILVAEDNLINQEVARMMLNRLGHTITMVADGQAAIDAVRQNSYDVLLLDVQMPVLDGEEAARQIRALGTQIYQPYIIALTANALVGDRERFLSAGMDDYLSKPVRISELQKALAAAIIK